MKVSELRQKSVDQLKKMLLEQLREQFSLRMKKSTGEMPKDHLFGQIRCHIARIKTILNEKQRGAQ